LSTYNYPAILTTLYPDLTWLANVRNVLGRYLITLCLKVVAIKALTRLERIGVIEMFKALWQLQISPAVILINYTVCHIAYLLSVSLMFVDSCIIVQFI
jgi:hypothetical protein